MDTEKKFGILRVVFGFVWLVDALLKWMPPIRDHIVDILTQAQAGQPALEYAWIQFWVSIANIQPELFGIFIALVETLLALSLITGIFSRAALWSGILFSFLVWSVPQGFGGPYQPGVTDIDSGIIYMLLFIALIIGHAWRRVRIFE